MSERGKQRRETHETSVQLTRKFALREATTVFPGPWGWYDSPLQGNLRSSIHRSFDDIFPKDMMLREYLEAKFENKKGSVVGVEFGGPGSKLFGGFSEGFIKKSVGITLTDQRSWLKCWVDKRHNHTIIVGDMQTEKTKSKLVQWLGDDKVDIIIERMERGLTLLPRDPYHIAKNVSEWYSLLQTNGVMLVQIPYFMIRYIQQWESLVTKEAGQTIQLKFGKENRTMLLEKKEDAPKLLPLLRARDVDQIDRRIYGTRHFKI